MKKCGCYVSCTFSWLSPPWWEQFSRRSYELLALILTKLSSLWRAMATWLKAIYLGGVWLVEYQLWVLCVPFICHGWALRDENSFHDGLMSFWLWFLPNSAHSDGPWLPDWKRYIWEECSLSNTSCGCCVSRTFSWLSPPWWEQFSRRSYELLALILTKLSSLWRAMATWLKAIHLGGVWLVEYQLWVFCVSYILMVEPSVMRTVFTTVLWASGFDSYQTQLTLTGHGYLIESDTFGRGVACRIPVVGVLCLVHSHGWALHDENSFHDGLMSFWLWFLPNSAHSDGPWLPDWKRYIWEECSLSNTSCGCCVSRTLHSHGWALRDENSFHDGLMSFWLWFLPNSAHSDGPWLCDWKRYIWEECSLSNTSCGCYVSRTFSWLSPPWWEQFSRRSYELLALILTKLSSLWRAMATWLKAIYLEGV